MLLLTRRIGEILMIGDDVTVTVLGVRGANVRLGIKAPRSVAVHREEIYQRIQAERTGKRPARPSPGVGAAAREDYTPREDSDPESDDELEKHDPWEAYDRDAKEHI